MIKIKLILLFYFILCVILGLLLSNSLLIGMLYIKDGNLENVLSNSNSLLSNLSSHELLMTQMSSQVFSLIIPAWIYSKLIFNSSEFFNKHSFNSETFFYTVLFFLSSIPLVALSAYLNQLLPLTDWMVVTELQMSEMIEKMLGFKSVSDLLIAVIVIAIIPAIAEEWVFRGIVQNNIIIMVKNPWVGLVIASIFFSAIHMQFQGFLPRFILGMILGYVYLTTGNLWYSILLHFFNNGFQVIGAYYYKEEILKQINNDVQMPNIYAMIFSIIACSYIGYSLYKKSKSTQDA